MNKAHHIEVHSQAQRDGRDYTVALVRDMEIYARNRFGLVDDWNVKIRFSRAGHRTTSWGGVRFNQPFVSIAVPFYIFKNPVGMKFKEYDHIADDPEIGTETYNDWAEFIIMLTTHEVAHAIQHSFKYAYGLFKKESNHGGMCFDDMIEGHGEGWQAIYRELRVKYLTAYRAGKGIRPRVTRTPKKRSQDKPAIGRATISHASYRNYYVNGDYDVWREWKPTKLKGYGDYDIGMGTIGIILKSGRRIRVRVYKSHYEMIG